MSGDVSAVAPQVLLLHGSGLSGAAFARIGGRLTRRAITWAAPDFMGSGDRAAWPTGHGPFPLGADVDVALSAIEGATRPLVLGHSYGGAVALQLALRYPDRIGPLVLFEPAVVHVLRDAGHAEWESVHTLLGTSEAAGVEPDMAIWVPRFVDFWSEPGGFERLSAPERTRYVAAGPTVHSEVLALMADSTVLSDYGRVQHPTWLVGGARSPSAARAVLDLLEGTLPNVRRLVTPGGHMAPLTHPDALCDILLAALSPRDP